MRVAAVLLAVGVVVGMSGPDTGEPSHSSLQCDVAGRADVDSADVSPVPLGASPFPTYPRMLRDAEIGDTVVVRFVVGADGMIEPATFCVERASYPSLSGAEIRAWRFEPARRDGIPVRATYSVEVIYSPRDTVRGPVEGARLLGEVDQPMLRQDSPRLMVGPMRRTFGLSRTGTAAGLEQHVERAMVNQLITLADVDSVPVLCLRDAPGAYRLWDRELGAAADGTMTRCRVGESPFVAEISLRLEDPRSGWYGQELLRVLAVVRTFDRRHCPANSFMCGRGDNWAFDCEVVADAGREVVHCGLAWHSKYLV